MRLNYTNKEALHSNNTIPDKNKVNDTDMNSIKNAVNQMSMYTKLSSNNDVWEFPGYEGTLIVGSIIPLEIEASTNPSGNASIKIGGTTYSVKDENGNSISAVGFEGQYYFVYNGTNLILKSNGGVSDYNSLSNQPQINGITLIGNKTLANLGINSKYRTFRVDITSSGNTGGGSSWKNTSLESDDIEFKPGDYILLISQYLYASDSLDLVTMRLLINGSEAVDPYRISFPIKPGKVTSGELIALFHVDTTGNYKFKIQCYTDQVVQIANAYVDILVMNEE